MKAIDRAIEEGKTNFLFIGGAGSGKSEIAVNYALYLKSRVKSEVHFFDMDMTKPLFRSRDVADILMAGGIKVHFQEQFMDAPTTVGGGKKLLTDENAYVVLDIGGDHIGARTLGTYREAINEDSLVYYVVNAYRPWMDGPHDIDKTLGMILHAAQLDVSELHLISNPNMSCITTPAEVIEGYRKIDDIVSPYIKTDFIAVKESLYAAVVGLCDAEVFPIRLYQTYDWEK